ncbi:MAG: hypothetical protein ACI8S6_000378 [Myxococcota bacterium]|jgi:hypothetical protein
MDATQTILSPDAATRQQGLELLRALDDPKAWSVLAMVDPSRMGHPPQATERLRLLAAMPPGMSPQGALSRVRLTQEALDLPGSQDGLRRATTLLLTEPLSGPLPRLRRLRRLELRISR